MTQFVSQHKRKTLESFLERGLVMLHLDPRRPGVDVPQQLRDQPTLRLNVAYGFRLPAFEIDDEGVYAVLSFNRQRYPCNIPWEALFAVTLPDENQEGMLWPASVPEEILPEEGWQALGTTGSEVGLRIGGTDASGSGSAGGGEDAAEGEAVEHPAPATAPATAEQADESAARGPHPFTVIEGGGEGSDEEEDPDAPRSRPVFEVIKD